MNLFEGRDPRVKKQGLRITQPPSIIQIHLSKEGGPGVIDGLVQALQGALGRNDSVVDQAIDHALTFGLRAENDNLATPLSQGISLRLDGEGEHTLTLSLDCANQSDPLFFQRLNEGDEGMVATEWTLVPTTRQNRLLIMGDENALSAKARHVLGDRLTPYLCRNGKGYQVQPREGEHLEIALSLAALSVGLTRDEARPSAFWDAVFSLGETTYILVEDPFGTRQLDVASNES